METEPPRRMSFGRIALHYTTKPFSQAQGKVQKATRTATHAIGSQISKPTSRKGSLVPVSTFTSSALTNFHLFSALPTEIRLQIWTETLPGPRIIQIREGKPRQGKLVNRQLVLPWVSQAPIPKLLHICQESRREGLRHYQLAFGKPSAHAPRIYVDFAHDTIYFGRRDSGATLVSVIGLLDTPSLTLADFQSSPDFMRVQRLALIPKGVVDLVEWEWKMLAESKLREILVVNQMTTGRSFRVGNSPTLRCTMPTREERAEHASTARAVAAMVKANERLSQRAVGTDLQALGRKTLPQAYTCEFVYGEGDEWVGPERASGFQRPSVGITNFFVV